MELAKGYLGSLKVGPTPTPVAIKGGTKYSLDRKRETSDKGPHIGSTGETIEVPGGKKDELKLDGDIPTGADRAGITDLNGLYESGDAERIEAISEEGYTILFAAGRVTNFKIETDGKEGGTWSATITGTAAVSETA